MTEDSEPQWVKDRKSVLSSHSPFSVQSDKVLFRGEPIAADRIEKAEILFRAVWIPLVVSLLLFIGGWFFLKTQFSFLDNVIKGAVTLNLLSMLSGLLGSRAHRLLKLTLKDGTTRLAFVRRHVAEAFCEIWADYSHIMGLLNEKSENRNAGSTLR